MLLHLFALSCQTVPLLRRNQMGIKKACLSSFWNTWKGCSDNIWAQRERPPQQWSNPASISIMPGPHGRQDGAPSTAMRSPMLAVQVCMETTRSHQTWVWMKLPSPFLHHQSYASYVKELKGNPRFFFCRHLQRILRASLGAQMVKRLSAKQETRVRSLGWEDPLEEEMATHSSVLAWKIPWTEEPGGLQSMGSQRVRHD